MTGKTLIVGYGNPLRGDDGVGQATARALAGHATLKNCEVVACHQLMPELAERLAAVDLVVFIDARAGAAPGSVAIARLHGVPAAAPGLVHHVDPAALLALAGRLYGRAPEAFLVSVGAGSLGLSENLSPSVAAALPEVVATVRRLVAEH
jgi:hydrogenase maturation protease